MRRASTSSRLKTYYSIVAARNPGPSAAEKQKTMYLGLRTSSFELELLFVFIDLLRQVVLNPDLLDHPQLCFQPVDVVFFVH